MKTFLLLSVLILSGCEGGGGASSSNSTPALVVAPVVNPTPVPTPAPTVIQLAVYSVSALATPPNHCVTAQETGSCATYQTFDFCWDDGLKNLANAALTTACTTNFPPNGYGTSYWSLGHHFSSDAYADPTYMDSNVIPAIGNDSEQMVNNVFAYGTPTSVNCTVNAHSLDCGTFTIDLTQVGL